MEIKKPTVDKSGKIGIIFGRPMTFPTVLVAEYDSDYVENVPLLTPTQDELDEISKVFEEAQAQTAAQGETSIT